MKHNMLLTAGVLSLALTAASCCRQAPAVQEKADAEPVVLKDYGAEPTTLNIESYTLANENFRTALWTGANLQVTLMSIPAGGDVGLELHNGMSVVTETARGVELGECMSGVMDVPDERLVLPLKPILRIATEQDLASHNHVEDYLFMPAILALEKTIN